MTKKEGLSNVEILRLIGNDVERWDEMVNFLRELADDCGVGPEELGSYIGSRLAEGEPDDDGFNENFSEIEESEYGELAIFRRLVAMMPKENGVWVGVSDLAKVIDGGVTVSGSREERISKKLEALAGKYPNVVLIGNGWIAFEEDEAMKLVIEADKDFNEEEVEFADVAGEVDELSLEAFVTLLQGTW